MSTEDVPEYCPACPRVTLAGTPHECVDDRPAPCDVDADLTTLLADAAEAYAHALDTQPLDDATVDATLDVVRAVARERWLRREVARGR